MTEPGRAGSGLGHVDYRAELKADADEVWKLVGAFDSLPRWHPLVAECALEGDEARGFVRRIRLHDGTIILNRLTTHSDAARSYGYDLVEGPLKVAFYRSRLRIVPEGEGRCRLEWSSMFDPGETPAEEIKARVESLIGPGVESLKRRFGG
jgi:hypothetical protein